MSNSAVEVAMFVVRIADSFHYMDESEIYTHGESLTWAEAVAAAKNIVDRCLTEDYQPGMTAEILFSRYKAFGDDSFIIPAPEGEKFYGWDFAKERCTVAVRVRLRLTYESNHHHRIAIR